ncbi:MAG: flavodoxin family protein [Bilophila wadsworthia]
MFSARQKEDHGIALPSRAELDPPEQTPHVCLLACSPHPDGSTDAAARLLEQALLSRGATVDRIRLREYAIHPCIGCGYCSAHPGHCVFDGDDVADLFRRMEHADSLILNIPVYFYGPALLKGFIDRAQIFWEQRREGTRTPRRPAHAVLCAARTRGDRLFEANLLILRCFLDTLGFSLHEPLLLRGVERPTDLLHSQAIAQIERFGLEAAEQATRFYHE